MNGHTHALTCGHCGAIHGDVAGLRPWQVVLCARCSSVLHYGMAPGVGALFLLTVAELAAFLVTNALPIVILHPPGDERPTRIYDLITTGFDNQSYLISTLALLTLIVLPATQIVMRLWVIGGLMLGTQAPGTKVLIHGLGMIRRWCLIPVFWLGTAVALGKIGALVDWSPGPGADALWVLIALQLFLSLLGARRTEHLWDLAQPHHGLPEASGAALIGCEECGLAQRATTDGFSQCPRCGNTLFSHKPYGLLLTWLWLGGALVLLLPANLLPVMVSSGVQSGGTIRLTILGGIGLLWDNDEIMLAVIVFVFSFLLPGLKIGTLAFLAAAAQWRLPWKRRLRTKLYRLMEFIGPWSLVDAYVVAVLVGLIQFGLLAKVDPGPGATAFATVVIFTMLAANSFDPRLVWLSDPRLEDDNA